MDIELDNRLRSLEKKMDDTYSMVRKMRAAQKRAAVAKLAYWAFLIILGIIATSLIKPYISQLGAVYGLGGGDSTKSTTTTDYTDLLKTLQN
jgi:hypothetical protein